MNEIAVAQLTPGDIGSRVIAIDQTGNAYTGTLTDLSATDWKYGKRPEDKVRIRVKVTSVEHSELTLDALPLDFRVQIERMPDYAEAPDLENGSER